MSSKYRFLEVLKTLEGISSENKQTTLKLKILDLELKDFQEYFSELIELELLPILNISDQISIKKVLNLKIEKSSLLK